MCQECVSEAMSQLPLHLIKLGAFFCLPWLSLRQTLNSKRKLFSDWANNMNVIWTLSYRFQMKGSHCTPYDRIRPTGDIIWKTTFHIPVIATSLFFCVFWRGLWFFRTSKDSLSNAIRGNRANSLASATLREFGKYHYYDSRDFLRLLIARILLHFSSSGTILGVHLWGEIPQFSSILHHQHPS